MKVRRMIVISHTRRAFKDEHAHGTAAKEDMKPIYGVPSTTATLL
jgi:hypothetical protein